ncbi:hypothetical protein UFOVP786_44 [uncultured Caudovirales phage]|uniref:Uncharacterized protein n=1 Tax=uncultured Caudovirales phage TaxID=2100421 RepID=A0A6J5NSL1_9CAUD|nr:hypothetical protein UFOVP786_44 [uncultured Caudovirales phage]
MKTLMAATREGVEGVAEAWINSRMARALSGLFMLAVTAIALPLGGWAISKLIEIDRKLVLIEQARSSDLESVRARFVATELRMAEDRNTAQQALAANQVLVKEAAETRAILNSVARDVARLVARDDARSTPRAGPQ